MAIVAYDHAYKLYSSDCVQTSWVVAKVSLNHAVDSWHKVLMLVMLNAHELPANMHIVLQCAVLV